MTKRKYPLWCVDTGDTKSESRYFGPFGRREDAEECHPNGQVRRCRAIKPSEVLLDGLATILGDLDDGEVITRVSDDAWTDFDSELARPRQGAQEAFHEWLDRYVAINAFVCDGDE